MEHSYKVKLENGEVLDSLSRRELEALYDEGKIQSHTLCQVDDDESWHPLCDLEDVSSILSKPKPPHLETTLIGKRKALQSKKELQDIDKTRSIKRPLSQQIQDREAPTNKTPEFKKEIKHEVEEIDPQADTRFFSVKNFLRTIHQEAMENASELARKEKDELQVLKKQTVEKEKPNVEEKDRSNKKKKIRPIAAIAIIVLFYFLLFDDDDNVVQIKPQKVNITFPGINTFLDENLSHKYLLEGIALYKQGTYLSKSIATSKFKLSLQYKFKNNKALGFLILSYAELLPNSANIKNASIVINRLLRIAEEQALNDINIAMGKALYFMNVDKNFTAVKAIEDYVQIKKKVTIKLYSIYLQVLIKIDDLDKAKNVYDKLFENRKAKLPPLTYKVISDYYRKNKSYDKSYKVLKKGLTHYPNSVLLLLDQADHALRTSNKKLYKYLLTRVESLNYESCPEFFAKYLEHLGVVSALQGKVKQAAVLFKKSLKEYDTAELRSKLATLDVEGDSISKRLILESKIIDHMRMAKKAMKNFEWEQAFLHAIHAVDINEKYIPARILLADIQTQRGFFGSAEKTLKLLKKDYPKISLSYFKLIDVYIESHRFYDALQEINRVSVLKENITKSDRYAFTLAKYFDKKKLYHMASRWYKKSIIRNPIHDQSYFALAKVYKQSGQLKSAKKYLIEAINLNPEATEYKILYSRILKEESSFPVAIGYLRGALENSKDRISLLGEIAANYYKSGQLKYYEETYKKIEGLNIKNEAFYKFLVQASILNDEQDEVIKYSKKLVMISPGLMDARINLVKAYLAKSEFGLAITHLLEIKKRMSSFPRVNYFISKVYYLQENFAEAIKFAEEEIKNNPFLPFGYLIKGKILFKQDDFKESLKSFQTALVYDYQNIESLLGLAIIRKLQNKLEQSRELLHRAMRFDKNNPEIHKELGLVYRGIGQSELAMEFLESYLLLNPAAPDSGQIKNIINLLK